MLSEDIASVRASLGILAGRVDRDDWRLLSAMRAELQKCAEEAKNLELELCIPPCDRNEEDPHYAA